MNKIREIIPYVLIILIVMLIRLFLITPVRVDGLSMYPTLKDGEIILLKKYDKLYNRFDIIVADFEDTKIIKRIIGLPGETLRYENNILYINDEKIDEPFIKETVLTSNFNISKFNVDKIPEDTYFVVGDNRNNSTDSRIIGFINKKDINGVCDFSIFPFNTFGEIR